MKFTSAFYVALAALAKFVVADSVEFGLLPIASGTDIQYAGVVLNSGNLILTPGQPSNNLISMVNDEGQLTVGSSSTFVVVRPDGTWAATTNAAEASKGFAISGGHITYNGNAGFFAVRSSEGANDYAITTSNVSGATGFVFRPTTTSGQVAPDFSAPAEEPSTTVSQITDGQIQAPGTATPISQITDGQIQAPGTVTPISQITDGQIQAPGTKTEKTIVTTSCPEEETSTTTLTKSTVITAPCPSSEAPYANITVTTPRTTDTETEKWPKTTTPVVPINSTTATYPATWSSSQTIHHQTENAAPIGVANAGFGAIAMAAAAALLW